MAKRKKNTFRSIVIPVVLLVLTASVIYYFNDYINKPKFVRYPAFGIDIPVNYEIHGIDVSRYQYNIDWKAVEAMQDQEVKIGFAFIKATEGVSLKDKKFRKNWEECKNVDIKRGAYHFFISSSHLL